MTYLSYSRFASFDEDYISALISEKCNKSTRAETEALIGGGVYSYIRVLPDEFLLKSVVITDDFKRNSSCRTRVYEYAPPPPPPQLTL